MAVIGALNILVGMDAKGVQTGARAAKKEIAGLGSDAKKIWDETRSPQERYEARLAKLAEHLRQDTIDQETFARAVRDASIALGDQGKGSGEGFREGSAALDAYRGRMEQLTQQLAGGAITQAQFSGAAQQAAGALSSAGAAAAESGAGHKRGEAAVRAYDDRVRHLQAALHAGQIDFAGYTHGVHEAREAMERAEHSAQRMERVLELGKTALATIGVGLGVEAAFDFLKEALDESEKAGASLRRLEAITTATGGAAGVTARQMRELAEEVEHLTDFNHLEVESAEAILATHKNLNGENFKRATEYAADLATVLESDVKSAAMTLGRALDDPINGLGALRRAGIVFDESEKELIADFVAAGRVAEAQEVILNKFAGTIDHAAEASQTGFGKLKNELASFKEDLGSGFGLFPWLTQKLDFFGVHEPVEKPRPKPKAERPADLETKSHREARKAIDDLVASLRQEAAAQGESATALAIAKAKREGLTEAELKEARAAAAAAEAHKKDAAALAEQKKQIDGLADSAKRMREQQAAANERFGLDAEEAQLDAAERQIDAEIAKRKKAAETLKEVQAKGIELGEGARRKIEEYDELARAKQDVGSARANLRERRGKEQTKQKGEDIESGLKSLHEGTRTPKEELEAEMAALKELYGKAKDAGKLTEDVDRDFHRKSDELRKKYAELDQPEEKKKEQKPTDNAALEKGSAEAWHAVIGKNDVAQKTRQQILQELRRGNAERARKAKGHEAAWSDPREIEQVDRAAGPHKNVAERRYRQVVARAERVATRRAGRGDKDAYGAAHGRLQEQIHTDIQRMRQIAEKNQVQVATFG